VTDPAERSAAAAAGSEPGEAGLDPAVAAAMRALDAAAALPVEERASALEAVHRQLAEALDPSPPGPASPVAGG
jgi:acyl-CoA reductase-like NAD-dependent aldehyde dehydrogenase